MPQIRIRNITSKRRFNPEYFKSEIRDEFQSGVKPDLLADFDKIVEQWVQKPDFQARLIISNDSIKLDAYAVGEHKEIFNLVSAGSPPHMIFPKNPGGRLIFQPGYVAASRPNQIFGGRARRFGSEVFRQSVSHPGFEARNFHQTIADKYKPDLVRRINNALKRAARRI